MRFYRFQDLVDEIIREQPAALGIAVESVEFGLRLPFENAPRRVDAAGQEPLTMETLRVALTIVEHALGDSLIVGDELVPYGFQGSFVPLEENGPSAQSGSAVAQSIRNLDNRVEFCRSLFCHEELRRRRLCKNDALFNFMMTVTMWVVHLDPESTEPPGSVESVGGPPR